MRWYRSWPAEGQRPAQGRAHVVDDLPRLVMSGYDYSTVAGGLPADEPGFCMLEWDVALDRVGRARFEAEALTEPDRVLVAPYDIYPVGRAPTCVHKVGLDPLNSGWRRPADPADTETHSFGLGCVYLPARVLAEWRDGGPRRLRDTTFSDWHIARYGTARLTWDVHPQHLHGD